MRNVTQEAMDMTKEQIYRANPLMQSKEYRMSLHPIEKQMLAMQMITLAEAHEQELIREIRGE